MDVREGDADVDHVDGGGLVNALLGEGNNLVLGDPGGADEDTFSVLSGPADEGGVYELPLPVQYGRTRAQTAAMARANIASANLGRRISLRRKVTETPAMAILARRISEQNDAISALKSRLESMGTPSAVSREASELRSQQPAPSSQEVRELTASFRTAGSWGEVIREGTGREHSTPPPAPPLESRSLHDVARNQPLTALVGHASDARGSRQVVNRNAHKIDISVIPPSMLTSKGWYRHCKCRIY